MADGSNTIHSLRQEARRARRVQQYLSLAVAGDLGHALARLLIASYFMASALGLVVDIDKDAMVRIVMPESLGDAISSGLMMTCAILIATSTHVRAAALVLSLFVLWNSLIANYIVAQAPILSEFWRDLALIGGLLMTYSHQRSDREMRMRRRRLRGGRKITPRRVTPRTRLEEGTAARTSRPLLDDLPAVRERKPSSPATLVLGEGLALRPGKPADGSGHGGSEVPAG